MEKRPPVGTTLWIVEEHLYYSGGPGDPQIEFVIYPCEVKRYIVGYYIQMELVGKHPDGPLSVRYSTLGGIGKYLFDMGKNTVDLHGLCVAHFLANLSRIFSSLHAGTNPAMLPPQYAISFTLLEERKEWAGLDIT